MASNRFGISLLSKKNRATAYKEELMVDKDTGEVLIKTPSGDTISYNYNSRLKSQISTIKSIANNVSVYGDIISIELDNLDAPSVMEYDLNYITTALDIPYAECKKILFNIDIDAITVHNTTGSISHDRNNMLVEMELSLYYSDGTASDPVIISNSIYELNSKVFTLNDNSLILLNSKKKVAGIRLSSFKIHNIIMNYSGEVVPNTSTIRSIFNSLFAIIQV